MTNATPDLNAVILRGIVDKLDNINPALNEEGMTNLLAVRDAAENLIGLVSALRIIDEMERLENVKEEWLE